MATIAPQPKLQFFDANGDPLVGGRLYSYIAGTTTPQATYTDESGSTTNTNPVILDSRGEASVWFGTGTYKLTLKTAADVEIWTVDDVGSEISVADLATGIQTWLGTPTSDNLRAAMVDETGTGALVFANAPTLVLPNVDVINEATPGVGVTVDGVVLKDNDVSAQDVTGSATVSAPIINATGTASATGAVRIFERNTNGTNYIALEAPVSVTGNRVLTLPDSVGNDQEFLRSDGSGVLTFAPTIVSRTAQTATGQTDLSFLTIPAWVRSITVTMVDLSTNGSSFLRIRVGSGSTATTGYAGVCSAFVSASAGTASMGTAGWDFSDAGSAASTRTGSVVLTKHTGNVWAMTGIYADGSTRLLTAAGTISLSNPLDRVIITTVNGTDTLDSGSVNIHYQ